MKKLVETILIAVVLVSSVIVIVTPNIAEQRNLAVAAIVVKVVALVTKMAAAVSNIQAMVTLARVMISKVQTILNSKTMMITIN